MNYTELCEALQEIPENSFTPDQLAMFTKLAEQAIYNTAQLPSMRFNSTGFVTAGNQYLTFPVDYLFAYSLAVMTPAGHEYLLNKDVNFIREAYPTATATGVPKHYAQFDDGTFLLGPTPDDDYEVELHYGGYPESIVTAGNTWLGDNFDGALLNGALIEAARFLQLDADVMKTYQAKYLESITLLKALVDGKQRQDMYRSGQFRQPSI